MACLPSILEVCAKQHASDSPPAESFAWSCTLGIEYCVYRCSILITTWMLFSKSMLNSLKLQKMFQAQIERIKVFKKKN